MIPTKQEQRRAELLATYGAPVFCLTTRGQAPLPPHVEEAEALTDVASEGFEAHDYPPLPPLPSEEIAPAVSEPAPAEPEDALQQDVPEDHTPEWEPAPTDGWMDRLGIHAHIPKIADEAVDPTPGYITELQEEHIHEKVEGH